MKKVFYLILACSLTYLANAQLPRMNMFYENFSWQNPAFTTDENAREIMLQSQFQNFTPGSANSIILLNYEESRKFGALGFNYFGNYFQQNQEHAIQVNYAYHFKLSDQTTLSAGVSAGAYLWRFDQGALVGNGSELVWNTGLRLNSGNLLIALSKGNKAGTTANPQSSLLVHYKYKIAEQLTLIPTAYFLSINRNISIEGIGCRFVLFDNLELGLFGAGDKGLYFTSGVTILEQIRIGYSLSNLGGSVYRFPSQELFLSYRFNG